MSRVLFPLYLIIELVAFIAVSKWIGVGWALLALGGLFIVGVVTAAWEMRRLTQRAMDDAIAAQEAMGGPGAMGHGSPMGNQGEPGHGGSMGATGQAGDSDAAGDDIIDPADREKRARRALASAGTLVVDSAMLMVGCVLLAIPGFVTTIFGLLLILPPTRWLIRTVGGASLAAWFQRTGSKSMFVVQRYGVKYGDDGAEVIDHDDPSSPSAPSGPAGPRSTADDASAPRRLGRGTGERITFDVPDDASALDDWARDDEKRRGGTGDPMVIDEGPDSGSDKRAGGTQNKGNDKGKSENPDSNKRRGENPDNPGNAEPGSDKRPDENPNQNTDGNAGGPEPRG
ncbi:FxsA family protein [Corynebacterium hansenii]|uniref:FxsA family protein n=1 Tax=Corynebacterium hansenii TaxID=394964 RepID=A0ABV7ZQV6_9CORY|nr:FxsA family protein [Corynebacterium hansenii]WJZ00061.1 phage T7 F exclusion suppressor FxsA [Corynebacterium hansenii]